MCLVSNHTEHSSTASENACKRPVPSAKLQQLREKAKRNVKVSLKQTMDRTQRILQSHPELQGIFHKISNCNSHRRCNQYQCSHCGVPFSEQTKRAKSNNQPEYNYDGESGPTGNFRIDWGNRYDEFEQLHSDTNVFTATINIDLFPFDESTDYQVFGNELKTAASKFRNKIRRLFAKNDVKIAYLGLIEDSVAIIDDELDHHVQNRAWKHNIKDAKYAIKLHIHMLVAGVTQEQFEEMLAKGGFGASNQVRCKPLIPETSEDGIVMNGSRGWGQYSAKMFVDYSCVDEDDKDWVTLFVELYRTIFTKRSRKCSFNARHNVASSDTSTNLVSSFIAKSFNHYRYSKIINTITSYLDDNFKVVSHGLFYSSVSFHPLCPNTLPLYYSNWVDKYNSKIKRMEKKFVTLVGQTRNFALSSTFAKNSRKRE